MKTSLLCLSFLVSLTSLTLTSQEEELRQINLGQIGPNLLQLLTAGLAGAGVAAAAGALSGGGKGKGKGKDGLFGKHGLFGNGKDGLFGKHGLFGKGKGKKRSLLTDEERLDISGLLSSLGGNTDGKGGKGKEGKGKEGKGKEGKGKDGKGKGKEAKGGKGKGKDSTAESSNNLLESVLSNFGLLGQIIQAALDLLTGIAGRSIIEPKAGVSPLPNPLTDPLGFIMSPLISAFLEAILAGDLPALMTALGDLAGTLITQFVTNAITG